MDIAGSDIRVGEMVQSSYEPDNDHYKIHDFGRSRGPITVYVIPSKEIITEEEAIQRKTMRNSYYDRGYN